MISEQEIIDRLISKREIEDDHWIFTGAKIKGRGVLRLSGRNFYVHRLAWTFWVGEIPEGWDVHHDCERKACFNPAHLKAMDADEHQTLHNPRLEKCSRGHKLEGANVRIRKSDGARICKKCIAENVAAHRNRLITVRLKGGQR